MATVEQAEKAGTRSIEPSFMDDSQRAEPMAQVLNKLMIPTAYPLLIMGIKSLIEGDFPAAAATLLPAGAQTGLYDSIYTTYKKLPQDKKAEVKRKAELVNEKINGAISRGVQLTVNTASVALGFILTAGGTEGIVTYMLKPNPLEVGAAVLFAGGGMLAVHEGVTGEAGRLLLKKPRKYPSVINKIKGFISELPKA